MKYGTIAFAYQARGTTGNRLTRGRARSLTFMMLRHQRRMKKTRHQGKGQRGGARVPKGVCLSLCRLSRTEHERYGTARQSRSSFPLHRGRRARVWACSTKWGSAHAGHACSRLDIKSSLAAAAIVRVSERIHGLICVIAVIALSCNFHQRDRKTRLRECGGAHCKSLNLEQALHSLR